jgi:hypothetical protein
MRVTRFALIALAAAVFSAVTARPASAAPWQLCLRLVNSAGGPNDYFMNFVVQGNAVLVTGMKNGFGDDHGPLFGSLAKPPNSPLNGPYELGLTVTYENMGDYANRNTENVVFQLLSNGNINFKKWLRSSDTFTQGQAIVINCPSS